MKIHLQGIGDMSVGISPASVSIEIEEVDAKDFLSAYENGREIFRKDLKTLFSEWCDDNMRVQFDDECANCGCIVNEKKECENENCITNLKE